MPADPQPAPGRAPVTSRAPGAPGTEPRWTSSAKSGIGTALDGRSRVWFAVSHGIVNEVYYDRVDRANTRDLGLLVTDGGALGAGEFFSEEKRDARSTVHLLAPGVPGYRLVNTCIGGRYEIVKSVIADPERSVLLQRVRFRPLAGSLEVYRLFVLLAPHIDNQGYGNDGWSSDYKGVRMLFARRGATLLALACAPEWAAMSCGYVGASDGWQQLRTHKRLVGLYTEAPGGNIALTGEVELPACADAEGAAEFVVALGFGRTAAEAGQNVRMSLAAPFERIETAYVAGWMRFQEATRGPRPAGSIALVPEEARHAATHALRHDSALQESAAQERTEQESPDQEGAARAASASRPEPLELSSSELDLYRMSSALMAAHEDKRAQGGIIASLSIPWGQSKGDHELGGYHLVWPRDLVETAGALLATGHVTRVQRTLRFLVSTQEADGHWPQNMWLDGTAYWLGVQMDETAFPILLADMLRRAALLEGLDAWPMVRRAAAFLVRCGPVTEEDRWEEEGGYSPFTLAVEIAALLAAADFADDAGEPAVAPYLRDTADAWNEGVERWTYCTGTELADRCGVDGYYARITPPDLADAASPEGGFVPIKNRPPGESSSRFAHIVSPDALALVRFGLRDPHDARIVNTVRVIDALLRRETRTGPIWYRYNGDAYGEHQDGAPFDGAGVGRGWPLLAGERGHYELAAGRPDAALQLLRVMRAQASDGGMLPEQVWDAADIPERELFNGRPTGGAMPLVWAHAEYVKLVRSLLDGRVFDTPPQPLERYVRRRTPAAVAVWDYHHRTRVMSVGKRLRIQLPAPALVHWSGDGWQSTSDSITRDTGLGVWAAELDTTALPPGESVRFTFRWSDGNRWEGEDFSVVAVPVSPEAAAPVDVARDRYSSTSIPTSTT